MLIERKTQLRNSILGGKKLEDRRSLIFPCNFDAMMAVLYSCLLVSVCIARTETKVWRKYENCIHFFLLILTEHQIGNTQYVVLIADPNPLQRLTWANPTNLLKSSNEKNLRLNWGREEIQRIEMYFITFSYNYTLHLLQFKYKESNDILSLVPWAVTERAFCVIGT